METIGERRGARILPPDRRRRPGGRKQDPRRARRRTLPCPAMPLSHCSLWPSSGFGAGRGGPAPRGAVNDFAGLLSEGGARAWRPSAGRSSTRRGPPWSLPLWRPGRRSGGRLRPSPLRGLGVGKKGEDRGVLILLAVRERKIRIQTGYGVEALLPDGKAAGSSTSRSSRSCDGELRTRGSSTPSPPWGRLARARGALDASRPGKAGGGEGIPAGVGSWRRSRPPRGHPDGPDDPGLVLLSGLGGGGRRSGGFGGFGGFGGGGFGGFGGGMSGGGGASRGF